MLWEQVLPYQGYPKCSLCSQAADIKVEVPTVTILTSQLLGHLYDSIYVFGPSVDGDAHVSGEKGLPVTDRCHSLCEIWLSSDFDERKTLDIDIKLEDHFDMCCYKWKNVLCTTKHTCSSYLINLVLVIPLKTRNADSLELQILF